MFAEATMNRFRIPDLERLPARILPCPIIEAVLEIRFVTNHNWSVIPGLLYGQIQEKYPRIEALHLGQLSENFIKTIPDLVYKPLTSFVGEKFKIHLGPRVVSLIANREYPGWLAIYEELAWLMGILKSAKFIKEGERLGMRYIDFFEGDIFPHLVIALESAGEPISGTEINFTTAFHRGAFGAKLILNNGASVLRDKSALMGSVFDLDLSLPATGFELFENGLDRFEDAHKLNKEIFFGLLKPEFLATLSPEYT